MKKLVCAVCLFTVVSTAATLFVWWDTAPAKITAAKYRLGQQQDLGIITREDMKPGPALWSFECIGSEKDCGKRELIPSPAVVNQVPEPGTLALVALGLAGLAWRKRK